MVLQNGRNIFIPRGAACCAYVLLDDPYERGQELYPMLPLLLAVEKHPGYIEFCRENYFQEDVSVRRETQRAQELYDLLSTTVDLIDLVDLDFGAMARMLFQCVLAMANIRGVSVEDAPQSGFLGNLDVRGLTSPCHMIRGAEGIVHEYLLCCGAVWTGLLARWGWCGLEIRLCTGASEKVINVSERDLDGSVLSAMPLFPVPVQERVPTISVSPMGIAVEMFAKNVGMACLARSVMVGENHAPDAIIDFLKNVPDCRITREGAILRFGHTGYTLRYGNETVPKLMYGRGPYSCEEVTISPHCPLLSFEEYCRGNE